MRASDPGQPSHRGRTCNDSRENSRFRTGQAAASSRGQGGGSRATRAIPRRSAHPSSGRRITDFPPQPIYCDLILDRLPAVFSYRDNKIVHKRRRGVESRAVSAATWEDWAVATNAAADANTFPKLLIRNAGIYGTRPAMRHKDLGIWQTWTWSEVLDIVRAYAVGLHGLGLKRGETIAIVGGNRPRLYWSVMAAQMLGAIPVPVYADAVADELAYVLAHADVRFAAVEDQEQVDKIQSVMGRVPRLGMMVYDEKRGLRDYDHSRLHSIDDIIADGRKALATDVALGGRLDAEI